MARTVDETIDAAVRGAAATTPEERAELDRVASALFGPDVLPQFGRYTTVRLVGAGALGRVYLAHDPELDRPVAIKSLARGFTEGARERMHARMQREARALARLRHPNVVAIYDVGIAGDALFLAMEFVEGRTFAEWLAEAPRNTEAILAVIDDAARGLAAAHEAGVVHRDVKPSNILVDRDGRARVVDFGLAFEEPDASAGPRRGTLGLTETGALLGTPAYMAPEQFLGAPVGPRADAWGLAIVLHEALAGARPFQGVDVEAQQHAVLEAEYVPPANASPHVRAALARALQRDPSLRFDDVLAFVRALRPAAVPTRTRRGVVPLAAIGVVAVAALWLGTRPNEVIADTPVAAITVAELHAVWSTPNAVRWAWAAEGTADLLRDYELVTGPTEADVLARTDRCRVFTRADNPELGHFLLPRTGGEDPVLATTTDAHDPDRPVFAQLVATDTAGRRSESNIAGTHTSPPPLAEVVVFDDAKPRGYPIPDAIEVSDTRPFAGTHHLEFVSSCGVPDCFANLRWQGLGVPLRDLTAGAFATTAYLELAVAIDGGASSWWSQLRLWYEGQPIDRIAHFNSFALRSDGEYRVLQVPLRAFTRGGNVVPAAEVANGLFEVGLGGFWPKGTIVRIDEIRVRW